MTEAPRGEGAGGPAPTNSKIHMQAVRAAGLPFQVASIENPGLVADGRWFAYSDGRYEVTALSATDVGVAARTMRKMLAADRLVQALREAEAAFMTCLDSPCMPAPDEEQIKVAATVRALLAEFEGGQGRA